MKNELTCAGRLTLAGKKVNLVDCRNDLQTTLCRLPAQSKEDQPVKDLTALQIRAQLKTMKKLFYRALMVDTNVFLRTDTLLYRVYRFFAVLDQLTGVL